MSKDRCSLLWKAAALEDGRLEGADRASFEQHASRCAECRAERTALAELHAQARALPTHRLSPLEHARRRAALLERANGSLHARRRAPRMRLALAAAVLCAFAVVALLLRSSALMSSTARSAASADVSQAPRYEVTEAPHAMLRMHADGPLARIDLADGSATFHVEHLEPHQRFVVSLPDAEVEVTGTRFTIDVTLGRTRAVTVTEGHVVFRRLGEHEMTLRAGEVWQRTDEVAMLVPATTAPSASSVATARARPRVTDPSLRPPPVAPRNAAGAKYDAAISSFVHGSYATADRELLEFAKEFPSDARCEDASFLSAVARRRMGDMAGARARAQSYLDAYPNGLRRREAQHLVDDPR